MGVAKEQNLDRGIAAFRFYILKHTDALRELSISYLQDNGATDDIVEELRPYVSEEDGLSKPDTSTNDNEKQEAEAEGDYYPMQLRHLRLDTLLNSMGVIDPINESDADLMRKVAKELSSDENRDLVVYSAEKRLLQSIAR